MGGGAASFTESLSGAGRMSGSRVDWRVEGEWVNHENTILFVGRVLGQVMLYGERERGGETETGKTKIVDKEIQNH